jgi:D-cysteine desulfhydrase/L-cysteate sulfo-lyase
MTLTFPDLIRHLPALASQPRLPLIETATSLHPMPNTGKRLGITLDIKRDDTLPLAMGGNKVRQLEYYLGQAQSAGCDTVLITGAVQSNFVRLCAAAARTQGWHPVAQLEDRVPNPDPAYATSGNVLLLRMLGAEIHHFHLGEDEAAADANLDRLARDHAERGRKPYVIHLGTGHPPWGGLGYAAAAVECFLQYQARGEFPDHVVVPSGSGLTHAGFLAGARAIGWDVNILGICVRRDASQQTARIAQRAREIETLAGLPATVGAGDIQLSDNVLAPGYGRMNDAVAGAIAMAAQQDAILLDPVYSGRCFAGLVDHVERGVIAPGDRVCFLHTGGTPGIFAYGSDITGAAG